MPNETIRIDLANNKYDKFYCTRFQHIIPENVSRFIIWNYFENVQIYRLLYVYMCMYVRGFFSCHETNRSQKENKVLFVSISNKIIGTVKSVFGKPKNTSLCKISAFSSVRNDYTLSSFTL